MSRCSSPVSPCRKAVFRSPLATIMPRLAAIDKKIWRPLRLPVGDAVLMCPNCGSVYPKTTRRAFRAPSALRVMTHRVRTKSFAEWHSRSAASTARFFTQDCISIVFAFLRLSCSSAGKSRSFTSDVLFLRTAANTLSDVSSPSSAEEKGNLNCPFVRHLVPYRRCAGRCILGRSLRFA